MKNNENINQENHSFYGNINTVRSIKSSYLFGFMVSGFDHVFEMTQRVKEWFLIPKIINA